MRWGRIAELGNQDYVTSMAVGWLRENVGDMGTSSEHLQLGLRRENRWYPLMQRGKG